MKELREGEFAEVIYHSKSKQETTRRTVIPTSVPGSIVRAIDLSDLSEEDRLEMLQLYKEYQEYFEAFVANAFNFETWAEHAKGKAISPKWRAFLVSNIVDAR